MKFGVREIVNVVFKAKNTQKIGSMTFREGQPVFYIDSAKTSTLEGAATTVYATGGRGNTRLIAWEGEKTLTFTVEDALLSPVSFAMLSGAGLLKGENDTDEVHFHQTSTAVVGAGGVINLNDALESTEVICATAPLYILKVDEYGDLTGEMISGYKVSSTDATGTSSKDTTITGKTLEPEVGADAATGTVMIDYYVKKKSKTVSELQIDAENFAGYYYVEADTLFRRQSDGKDLPANLTLPNVKIQSNFTFSMASTGDPSTFTFTMDALPGYTYFNNARKVLCAIQIVDDVEDSTEVKNDIQSVFPHPAGYIAQSSQDSVVGAADPDAAESDITARWNVTLSSTAISLDLDGSSTVESSAITIGVTKNSVTVDNPTIEYNSSNINIATIDSATKKITGKGVGTATITVTVKDGNKVVATKSITVTVTDSENQTPSTP